MRMAFPRSSGAGRAARIEAAAIYRYTSMNYVTYIEIRKRKYPVFKLFSQRIATKAPSLRDGSVTAAPRGRRRVDQKGCCRAAGRERERRFAAAGTAKHVWHPLPNLPNLVGISDTWAPPPDSSPLSPHLVVDSEFRTIP